MQYVRCCPFIYFDPTKSFIWLLIKLSMYFSEICIWSPIKGANSWWRAQRWDVSCNWLPGLHRSQRGFLPTRLHRNSLNPFRFFWLVLGNSALQLPSQVFCRIKDWLDHLMTLMCFFFSCSFVALAVHFGSLLGDCRKPIQDPFLKEGGSKILWYVVTS